MAKIFATFLASIFMLQAFSQKEVPGRKYNTMVDDRVRFLYNMVVPRFTDTTQANSFKGNDSCGAIISTYDNKRWIRSCNPKRWDDLSIGDSATLAPVINLVARQTGFPTVAAMVAAGDNFRQANGIYQAFTQGHYAIGDGGEATYKRNDTCTHVKDSMTHILAGTGCWELIVTNKTLNVKGCGLKEDAVYLGPTPYDNTYRLLKLITIAQQNGYKIYIPANRVPSSLYYFSPFTLTSPVEIYGDGPDKTILLMPGNITAIKTTTGFKNGYLHDFSLFGNFGFESSNVGNESAIGIWINSPASRFERIEVRDFDGYNWLISADLSAFGTNANENTITNCSGYGAGIANIRTQGGDGNANLITNFKSSGAARVNIWEGGFLGNTWTRGSTATAASDHSKQKSVVKYSDNHYYIARQTNTNVIPAGHPDTWEDYGTTFSPVHYLTWNADSTYLLAANLYSTSANSLSSSTDIYLEPDAPTIDSSGTQYYGGTFGLKNPPGSYLRSYAGGFGSHGFHGLSAKGNIIAYIDGISRIIGFKDVTLDRRFGMYYDSVRKMIGFGANGDLGSTQMLTANTTAAEAGRTLPPFDGQFRFAARPIFFNEVGQGRTIGHTYYSPIHGGDLGDIDFSDQAGTNLLGYKYNGSSWDPLYTGNGNVSTVTTTDSSATTIAIILTVTNQLARYDISVIAKDSTTGKTGEWTVTLLIDNTSGTTTIKSIDVTTTFLESGMPSFDPSATVSGTSVLLKVTGGTGATIKWSACIKNPQTL